MRRGGRRRWRRVWEPSLPGERRRLRLLLLLLLFPLHTLTSVHLACVRCAAATVERKRKKRRKAFYLSGEEERRGGALRPTWKILGEPFALLFSSSSSSNLPFPVWLRALLTQCQRMTLIVRTYIYIYMHVVCVALRSATLAPVCVLMRHEIRPS